MSWRDRPINEVCSHTVDCVNRTAPVVDYETPYKMLRTTNVRGGFVDTDNVRYVIEETYQRWSRRLVPERGDVFLTREAPLGDVGRLMSDDQVFLGQRLFQYRADPEKLDGLFLAYVLQSPKVQGRIRAVGLGATVEHAKVGDFERLLIPVPPLETQTRIGKTLSAYDDLIESNRRRIGLLEEAARRLYREWFVHFRFPGHEHVKIVDGIPDGWERIAPARFIYQHIGGGWGKDEPEGKESEPAYVIRGTDMPAVENGTFKAVGLRYHSPSNLGSRLLSYYDVIFEVSGGSSTQPIARTLVLTPERLRQWNENVICASFCKKFSFRSKSDALFFYFHTRVHRDRGDILVYQKESASSLKNFNFEGFMKGYVIPVPTQLLRKMFFDIADHLVRQQSILAAQNGRLAEARDLLLPRLMNGEIAV